MSRSEKKERIETSRRMAYGLPLKCRQNAAERLVIFRLALLGTDRPGEMLWPAGLCQHFFRRRPFIHLGPEPFRGPIARNLWIGICPGGLVVKNLYAPPEIEPLAGEIFDAHGSGAAVVQTLAITIEAALEPGRPGFSELAARFPAQGPAGLAPTRLITRWTLHDWAEILPCEPAADVWLRREALGHRHGEESALAGEAGDGVTTRQSHVGAGLKPARRDDRNCWVSLRSTQPTSSTTGPIFRSAAAWPRT